MSRVLWRWSEKDFGFRFKSGAGQSKSDFYQASEPGAFYTVPAKHRKLSKDRVDTLAAAVPPTSPRIVTIPWKNYDNDWDWIESADGILLNFAGCLDQQEIDRREDEGVARAMELVATQIQRPAPAPQTIRLVQQVHVELMGTIYPFAGRWRTVALHKGGGPTKWPLPPLGIEWMVNECLRPILARSPVISDDDAVIFSYVAEVMGMLLAIHPFREGNGRTAFIIANLILMQNNLLPLDAYDRKNDEARYYAACEEARIHRNYDPLASLVAEWEQAAQTRWEAANGQ
jgi:cell filamentation protein